MAVKVEFFFDLSSPWTRLAFHNIQPIVAHHEAEIRWRPFLVGAVFNEVNDAIYASRAKGDAPKHRNTMRWLKEWADLAGVTMNFPSAHHPLRSVTPMRFCCAIEDQAQLFEFSTRAFEAYFGEQENLDDIDVLIEIAAAAGLDGKSLAEASRTDPVKARLRTNTQEAIDRGAFGSPTIFIDDDHLYFGNDQLPLVDRRLALLSQ